MKDGHNSGAPVAQPVGLCGPPATASYGPVAEGVRGQPWESRRSRVRVPAGAPLLIVACFSTSMPTWFPCYLERALVDVDLVPRDLGVEEVVGRPGFEPGSGAQRPEAWDPPVISVTHPAQGCRVLHRAEPPAPRHIFAYEGFISYPAPRSCVSRAGDTAFHRPLVRVSGGDRRPG